MPSKHPSIEHLRRAGRRVISGTIRLVMMLSVIAGIMAACLGDQRSSDQSKSSGCGNAEMAHIMSRHFVGPKLTAPASARFPGYHDREISVVPGAECEFTVYGYVDSQNAFGAVIRTRYVAHMRANKNDGKWHAARVEMR